MRILILTLVSAALALPACGADEKPAASPASPSGYGGRMTY